MSWYMLVNYACSWLDDIWTYLDLRVRSESSKERRRREGEERGRRLLLQRMETARCGTLRQCDRSRGLRWRRVPGAVIHKAESFARKRKQVISKQKRQVQRSIRCRSNTTL